MSRIRWIFSVLLLTILVGTHGVVEAADDAKLTKTISEGFKINPQSVIEISNKYGDVLVENWDQDSVKIVVTVTAFGKDEKAAENLLDRTEIQFDTEGAAIEANTLLSKSDGWIRDFWNELSGYSQTIISKDQLTIDYRIFIPSNISLEIENKYGDIIMPDRIGRTVVDLSTGNFQADEMTGETRLTFRYGTADIGNLNNADILLKSADLFLDHAEEIELESNSSTIQLGSINSLNLVSRTDKITINDLGAITGRTSFTKIRIRNMQDRLDLDTNYGSLLIEQVSNQFNELLVRGNSTDMDLTFKPYGLLQHTNCSQRWKVRFTS